MWMNIEMNRWLDLLAQILSDLGPSLNTCTVFALAIAA